MGLLGVFRLGLEAVLAGGGLATLFCWLFVLWLEVVDDDDLVGLLSPEAAVAGLTVAAAVGGVGSC